MVGRTDPPVRAIRVPPKPQYRWRGLEPDAAAALAKAATGWHPQGTAVLAGMYLALRREEIATMEWERFDPDLTWYTVLGKGAATHTLPVHPLLADQLRHRRGNGYLFPGHQGRQSVTPYTVQLWLARVCDEAGIVRATPHQMRHTAIATVNDTTGDLRTAQQFARHVRPETTSIYTRVTSKRLRWP